MNNTVMLDFAEIPEETVSITVSFTPRSMSDFILLAKLRRLAECEGSGVLRKGEKQFFVSHKVI